MLQSFGTEVLTLTAETVLPSGPRSRTRAPNMALPSLAIGRLRPTQITVGYREVAAKRRRYRMVLAAGHPELLERRPVPIILGPEAEAYALDRHHGLCALLAEGVTEIPAALMDDLSGLSQRAFWSVLDARGWCHPYDADGGRLSYDQIPASIGALCDDPFRSLASALRRVGGFDKVKSPFSEFAWADFLRRRLDRSALEHDFDGTLQVAFRLARSDVARRLPGWRGAWAS
jgi:hypothetical protein